MVANFFHGTKKRVWVYGVLVQCCLVGLCIQRAGGSSPGHAGEVPFKDSMETLPLLDVRVATFGQEWSKTADRPYGVFYEPNRFPDITTPVQERWIGGVLELDVDTGSWFNGWRLKLDNVDWSEYRDWQLAIRVRFSERMFRRFKVELKEGIQPAAPCRTYRVDLNQDEIGQMRRRGFGDILIPLWKGEGSGSLGQIAELVLVFESGRVEAVDGTSHKGLLAIHSIRLAPPQRTAEARPVEEVLDDLAARAFLWFETYRHPASGLVPDRAPNWRSSGLLEESRTVPCSIASVGYYLSILPDAVKTGRLSEGAARERAATAMRFLETNAEQHAGFLHHFLDMRTGKSVPGSEVSVLDSSILFNGCMVASVYFGGDVAAIADCLLARVDWNALLIPKETGTPERLAMAWEPQRGVYGPMDVRSSEFAMACLLAIGIPSKGVDPGIWRNTRVEMGQVEGMTVLNPTHPLFTSYYGLGWHMLQQRLDPEGVDLWENARAAALANRAFCRSVRDETYQQRWGGWWGISAGDSPRGYMAPGPVVNAAEGTVWPTAALAALPWAPKEIKQDLGVWIKSPVWEYVLGPYGLAPFNLQERWIGTDLIGIDLGSFYLAVANYRRATVWDLWKQHPIGRSALDRIYRRQ